MDSEDRRRQPISIRDSKWPVYLLIVVLSAATVVSAGYLYHQKQENQELASTNQALGASLIQLRSEIQAMREQINTPPTPVRAAAFETSTTREKQPAPAKARPVKTARAAQPAKPKDDPRFNQLQGQLTDQQKLLASTREDLEKARQDLGRTRDDLQTDISSTRGELSGSIARTHEELVALQRRGERNYYEFQLTKSKAFERVGPLRLSLRKADTKHKRFDMNLMVDDNQLEKKSVNLYETVWLNLADRPQPLELVVNSISKDHISGYLSEPKYKRSELQTAASVDARPAR